MAALPQGVTGKEGTAQLVAGNAKSPRPAGDFTTSNPTVLSNDSTYNSTVLATATAQSGLRGSKTFRYNRVPLSQLLADPQSVSLGTTVYGSLSTLSTASGLVLTQDDLVDGPVGSGGEVTLVAKSTSFFFIPGTQLLVGKSKPPLSNAFTSNTILWS